MSINGLVTRNGLPMTTGLSSYNGAGSNGIDAPAEAGHTILLKQKGSAPLARAGP